MAVPVTLASLVQNSSMQGFSDTEVSELIVAPNRSPFHSVPTTATPVANAPITERKRLGSMGTPCGAGLCADDADIRMFMSSNSSWPAGGATNHHALRHVPSSLPQHVIT